MQDIGNITHTTNSTVYTVKNIFQDLDIKKFNEIFEPYLSDYVVLPSETPEKLALKLYGDLEYAYVLFYINGISNVANDWPLDDLSFKSYIIKKYGSVEYAKNNIKYYYDESGSRVTELTAQGLIEQIEVFPISYYEYEELLNESKTEIKIIDPSNLEVLVAQLTNYKRTGKYEL